MDWFKLKKRNKNLRIVSNDEDELVEFENTFGSEVREFQVRGKNEALILLYLLISKGLLAVTYGLTDVQNLSCENCIK